jgi:PKD repeat protein
MDSKLKFSNYIRQWMGVFIVFGIVKILIINKSMDRLKYLLTIVFPSILLLSLSVSCKKDIPEEAVTPPVITFVSGEGEYRLKIGDSVDLIAAVSNTVNPVYTWRIGEKIVSTVTSFTFVAEKTGEYFVNFRVDADNGSDEKQLKILAMEKTPPKITLPSAAVAFINVDKVFVAAAENAENAVYVWRLDGEIVSNTSTYTFNRTEMGIYTLTLKVTADDGQDLKTITVTTLPEQQPEIFFDNGRYRSAGNAGELRKTTVPYGKPLVLAPVICNIDNPAAFVWTVNGATQAATGEYFVFEPAAQGVYIVAATEQSTGATAEVQVTCTPPEGVYRRTGGANRYAANAFYYMPAPGQFVNDITAANPDEALSALQGWCGKAGSYFHIGAFGGYWIVGFDHSVDNKADAPDLAINGNAFSGWCEAGVVWVMQDNNGNGLPDDAWYELKGSETGKPETRQRYAITYYKPADADYGALWADNAGRTGTVDKAGGFPEFVAEEYYTLVGTCLNSTFEINGGLESSKCYEWGYVDGINNSPSRPNSNEFWIEDAIQADGSPANLQYVDFVKVHTAVVGQGAAVGELSTESYCPVEL